jgi:hypothetical protein
MTPSQKLAVDTIEAFNRSGEPRDVEFFATQGLSGDHNRDARQVLMARLTGAQLPKAKCGINALLAEYKALKTLEAQRIAAEPLPASVFQPHAFIFEPKTPALCKRCTLRAGNPVHLLALPGFEDVTEQRADAAAIQQGEELTAAMREPLKDVSRMAGRIERDSPLFFGLGENPTLF